MPTRTLIRGATVVHPSPRRDQPNMVVADVLIEADRIVDIDAPQTAHYDNLIDARGLHLMPGVVDDQVHFRQPGLTHKEDLAHASRACAAGGVTTFLEMPNTKPSAITTSLVEDKERMGAADSRVNYGFYIGATGDNLDQLKLAESCNIPGIKIFIGSSTGSLLVDEQEALEAIFGGTQLPICAHCEDETTVRENMEKFRDVDDVAVHSEIRDHRAAYICTQRAIELAQRYDHRFHVLHLSTAGELPLLEGGDPLITAEVCPHHLLFNINDYGRLGSLVQMNPSIKTAEDNQGLWKALVDGQIQVVATDHAPHTMAEKQQRYPASPSGLPAVENSLSLMLHRAAAGQCTLSQIVAWMCDAPARVWDIVQKGRIEVGYDADLVLVDLQRQRTIQNENQFTKCGWSPWHGETVMGVPVMTFVGGDMVFRLPADKEVGEINDRVRGRKPLFDHARGGYWATPDGIGLR